MKPFSHSAQYIHPRLLRHDMPQHDQGLLLT